MSSSPRTPPPAAVRVALVGCTGLLGDIIRRAIGDAALIDVVGEFDAAASVTPFPETLGADLVLWHNADESAVAQWLRSVDRAPRVLATVADGRGASLWQLVPARTQLGELSPAMLIDTIRADTLPGTEPAASQENPWANN